MTLTLGVKTPTIYGAENVALDVTMNSIAFIGPI